MLTLSVLHKPFKNILVLMLLLGASAIQAEQMTVDHGSLEITIEPEYVPESLLIMIGSQDITAFSSPNATGVTVTPPALPEAQHQSLLLSFTTVEGYDVSRRIELLPGQETYYHASTGLGITVRAKLHDKNDINKQDHEVDAHLEHQGTWAAGAWSGDVNADIWYLDRGTDITPVEDNRAEVVNYYASAKHQNDRSNFLTEAGYIQLHESQNTVSQLARRGAHARLTGERMSVDVFSVNSQQHLGSEGGAGLGDGNDDTIAGFSAGFTPVASANQTLKLKAIYSKGTESGDSLGILGSNISSEGDVAGLLVESTFNKLGLTLEAEIDRSRYDADSSDAVAAIDDDAYALRLKGQAAGFKYHAAFEHIGPNYSVVANPLLQNDREYITLGADFDRGEHGFAVQAQVEHDNLDKQSSRSQLNKTYLTANYRFRKGRRFSTFVSLQNNQIKSSDEPSSADIRDTIANSMLGKLSFSSARWNNQFSMLLSDLADKRDASNDSQIVSFSYSPALSTQQLYFTPSASLTETEFNTGLETRQSIFSLYLQGKAFDEKLDYQLSASVSELSDNANNDEDSTTVIARSQWLLGNRKRNSGKPQHSIGLELEHFDTETNNSASQDDSLIWLIYRIELGYQS